MEEKNNLSQATVYAGDFNYLQTKAQQEQRHGRYATQDIPSSSSCIYIEIEAGGISLKNVESDKIMLE